MDKKFKLLKSKQDVSYRALTEAIQEKIENITIAINIEKDTLIASSLTDLIKSGALYVVEDVHTGAFRVQFDGMTKVIQLQEENKLLREKLDSLRKILY